MRRSVLLITLAVIACLAGWGEVGAPALAAGRQTMTFVPGDRSWPVPRVTPRPRRRAPALRARPPVAGRHVARRGPENDETPAAIAQPGQGFTLQNGVLTYPAPARFQPKNLKPR